MASQEEIDRVNIATTGFLNAHKKDFFPCVENSRLLAEYIENNLGGAWYQANIEQAFRAIQPLLIPVGGESPAEVVLEPPTISGMPAPRTRQDVNLIPLRTYREWFHHKDPAIRQMFHNRVEWAARNRKAVS